jgi:hypothetical protein
VPVAAVNRASMDQSRMAMRPMVVAVRVVMAATYHVFYGEAKLQEPNCRRLQ